MSKRILCLIIWQLIIWGGAIVNSIVPDHAGYLFGFAMGAFSIPFGRVALFGENDDT